MPFYLCLWLLELGSIHDFFFFSLQNQKEAELNLQTTMEQLSLLQVEKQAAEESLASQLAATKEELLAAQATCGQLKKNLAVANDKLSKSR